MRLYFLIFFLALFISSPCMEPALLAQTDKGKGWKVRVFAFDLMRGGSSDIFVTTPGGKPKRIAAGEHPVMAPTGDKVVFCTLQNRVSEAAESAGLLTQSKSVWSNASFAMHLINEDGSGRRDLFKTMEGACPTDWSPDGRNIAFNALGNRRSMVAVASQDGTSVKVLGEGYDAHWSPDGKQLVFCRDGENGGCQRGFGLWMQTEITRGKFLKTIQTLWK